MHYRSFILKFFYRIFKVVLLFSYQCSIGFRLAVLSGISCDSFNRISLKSTFVNMFFIFSICYTKLSIYYINNFIDPIICNDSQSILAQNVYYINKLLLMYILLTEKEGFEPSRRVTDLHPFQGCPFNLLGTSPNTVVIKSSISILSHN